MNNRIIFTFILISVAFSQWPSPKFGNKAPLGITIFTGINQPNIIYNTSSTQNSISTTPLSSLHFGIEKFIKNTMSIGARYTVRGAIQSETISGTNKYNYLNSYILKSFKVIKNIYILAGGEIGIFIDGEFDSTICDDNECVSYEEVTSPIDYGIILGSGINLGKNIDCRLTYYHGLRNVIDRSGFADYLNFKHRDLQILIGYKF